MSLEQASAAQVKRTVRVASRISGTGMAVPEKCIPNSHFESYLETSDEWIQERTGIKQRFWADSGVGVSEIAEIASRKAIENARLTVDDIDGIVFATVTPDFIFPSAACCLQRRLGMKKGFAFDVNAVCSGFVYALVTADSLIASGQAKHLLVVGADFLSQTVNKNDRSTCILFGDGAGAIVLSSVSNEQASSMHSADRFVDADPRSFSGLYASELHSDGTGGSILCVPQGTAAPVNETSLAAGEHFLYMEGREVFKRAVRMLGEVNQNIISRCGLEVTDVDYFLSHQANSRILQAMAKHLDVPIEKVLMNVDTYGNTSAASVPILLAESFAKGILKKGQFVVLSAFGGGLTWGAVGVRL